MSQKCPFNIHSDRMPVGNNKGGEYSCRRLDYCRKSFSSGEHCLCISNRSGSTLQLSPTSGKRHLAGYNQNRSRRLFHYSSTGKI